MGWLSAATTTSDLIFDALVSYGYGFGGHGGDVSIVLIGVGC